jgi:hypothetical protein
MDHAQRRLGVALVGSLLLHLWFVHGAQGLGARRVSVASAPALRAILPPAVNSLAPVVDARPAEQIPAGPQNSQRDAVPRLDAPAAAIAVSPRDATLQTTVATIASASAQSQSSVQPSDPNYYGARSLDVYPKAITPLTLAMLPNASKVRATVFIDEMGIVKEVRAVEANTAEAESAARDLLFATRFTPAMKDGRVVKAQVLVSLE